MFKCDRCKKSFSQPDYLKEHQHTHTGQLPYTGDVCTKSYNQSGALKFSLSLIWGSGHLHAMCVRNLSVRYLEVGSSYSYYFTCDIFKKSCNMSGNLKVHQHTHIGERPIKCDVCKKSFNQSGDLKVHLHTQRGRPLFTCVVCMKFLRQSGALKEHLCTNSGEQPLTCDVCKQVFQAVQSLEGASTYS